MSENYNLNGLSIDSSVLKDPKLYAPTLREFWDPSLLSDLSCYIEVGEIKLSNIHADNCQFVELWVNPCHSNGHVRSECQNPKRRSIRSVLMQIEELCQGKNTCVLIMEDDNTNGTDAFYRAVYPIVTYLKLLKYIKAVILYTNKTNEEIINPRDSKFSHDSDKRYHIALYGSVDAYITQQPNCFSDSPNRKVFINNKRCSTYVSAVIHRTDT